MKSILHLDSSPRGDRSLSRALTNEFNRAWQQTYPEDKIIYRDLGHNPFPLLMNRGLQQHLVKQDS